MTDTTRKSPGVEERAGSPESASVRPLSSDNAAQLGSEQKILSFAELSRWGSARDNARVVHAHGVFDLLHIGHIRHLERARALGDHLVVTVTPDRFVNKGPDRPVFTERLRAEAIAALDCVDYVAVNLWPTAVETIRGLRPDVYVKGSEYTEADDDVTGGIALERAAVESCGGRLEFTDEVTFSSSNLLNRHTDAYPEDVRRFLAEFSTRHHTDAVIDWIERASSLRIAVIGESIIDEYQYCDAIGKSSKEPMLAVRPYSMERFAGGVLAVANHLASVAGSVDVVSVIGGSDPASGSVGRAHEEFIASELHPSVTRRFSTRSDGPTIVKRRFIDRYFFHKLLAVYEMNDSLLAGPDEEAFLAQIDSVVGEVDLVVVVDFGHGVIGPRAIELISSRAKFLALNVQSNAGNHGFHTVTRWPRADYVTLTENELRLETRDPHGPVEPLVEIVAQRMGCDRMVVTRGANGCLCRDHDGLLIKVPAVATRIRDRIGAGDTFLSLSAPCVVQGAPLEIAALVGSAASAHAVATVGHRSSVEKLPLIRHIQCLLK